MKIGVISSQVFKVPLSNYGGLEFIAYECAEGLAKLGEDVTLFAPEGSITQHAKLIATGPAGSWDEKKAYNSYWKHLPDFDVFIDHSWQKYSYLLKMEGVLKAPILGVYHAPVNTQYQTLPPVENPCMVCISKDQANHFEALFGREARVCYNGVNTEYYKAIPGIKRTNRFLFLARFSRIKGALIAIEACKKAGVGLDLVGDTSITNEPDYFNQCKNLCDGTQIRMVGPATRGETVYWYSQAHALLHPVKDFREPFGLAPVESMLCDCPVIAWSNGAMKETIKDAVTGRLVKSYDEFYNSVKYSLFPDPVFDGNIVAENWRKVCRESVLKFSVENMAKRYRELCEEALNKGW